MVPLVFALTAVQLVSAAEIAPPRVELSALLRERPGLPDHVEVTLGIPEGWHLYWMNPGDSGLAPRFRWEGVRGTPRRIAWPVPDLLASPQGHVTFVHEDRMTVLFELEDGAAVAGESSVVVRWVACREVCVPGESRALLRPASGAASPQATDYPSDLSGSVQAQARDLGDRIALKVSGLPDEWTASTAVAKLRFICEEEGVVVPRSALNAPAAGTDGLIWDLAKEPGAPENDRIRGLIVQLEQDRARAAIRVEARLERTDR